MLHGVLVILVPGSVSSLLASSAGYAHKVFQRQPAVQNGLVPLH